MRGRNELPAEVGPDVDEATGSLISEPTIVCGEEAVPPELTAAVVEVSKVVWDVRLFAKDADADEDSVDKIAYPLELPVVTPEVVTTATLPVAEACDAAVPLVVGSGSFSEAVVEPKARVVEIVVPLPSFVVLWAVAADCELAASEAV